MLVKLIMKSIYKQNKREIKHIGSKRFGVQFLLKSIYTNNGLLYTEQQRFFGEFDVKCVVATIFSNDRKIGFLLERLESRFDAQHILRTVGLSTLTM